MDYLDFFNKVVLVTGAAGGIGAKLCDEFDSLGAKVYSTDLADTDRKRFTRADISDPATQRSWVDDVLEREGRIDVLVNNAGICPRTALPDIDLNEWNRVIQVNLTSVFSLSQIVVASMIEHKCGAIVNLASMAGKLGGIAVGAHYSASKAAIMCLTKTFARYGAPHGVRVNAVAPGVIDTDMTRAATAEQIAGFNSTIPLGRIADKSEVTSPIIFLASNMASYVTGVTLDINGGLLMD